MRDSGDRTTAETAGSAFDTPIHVESESHLNDLIKANHVLLVDFYADWCGPCQMLEPTVERLATETRATVAKVDIDELRPLARANEVQGVPTMLLYVDGELAERVVGVRSEDTLRDIVTDHL
jgi:thioredoxin 1